LDGINYIVTVIIPVVHSVVFWVQFNKKVS